MIRFLIVVLAVVAISLGIAGCWQRETHREGTEVTKRELVEAGEQGGVPFHKTATETTSTKREDAETAKSGLDEAAIGRVVQVAVAAATGDLRAGIAALHTREPITGNANLDSMLSALVAYLGAKGAIAGGGAVLRKRGGKPS